MSTQTSRVTLVGEMLPAYNEILTPEVLSFLKELHENFNERRIELLQKRVEKQKRIDAGEFPKFLEETKHIREADWTIAKLPKDLEDRRVEITGPVDRKMVINALNSEAHLFMADFEDSNAPTWENAVEGQINLRDAVKGTISHENDKGKEYRLNEKTAVLIVRPRGWHLEEKHMQVDGKNMSGSLVDFGLYFFHNAKALLAKGSGPYFYLPKMESYLEARLWNDVFVFAQKYIGIPNGTIKATVLLETIHASFEMDEILYELKDHSAGLNCGRWDYIFSFLKSFRNHNKFLLPDRAQVTMTAPFMRSYSLKVIQTCHRRNAPAIGGMAAQIPIKNNPEANEAAFEKVRADKEREALDGHDGTWVAHPGLVPVAMEVFNHIMKTPNQIFRKREEICVTENDLLEVPVGTITEEGLRMNISVGIQYIASWLSGRGAAPIYNLMEDAATAEISRAQVWQWIRHEGGKLNDGRNITLELMEELKEEELAKIEREIGKEAFKKGRFQEATTLFTDLVRNDEFVPFLTLPGYEIL
ncbi:MULTISPECIES: malate synthase A [Bacillus cereus group]|uniref:malate synthase A n=1 Tax=Bacillus cereus group TaxID=86661 RepID=UPI002AC13726|nr:malate synthase A [Bacillus cereus]MDA2566674.1 malate synthase A [Bacillus cereus]MDA2571789.1 malate synthase A [Bacillus cereus]MDZ4478477.1 malate synthase A [Bacillus cereus]MDZ4494399.1 malate synthase A [Bacillus cereus]MDZ4517085.1 malate synthase A [Bacillus cereus]